MFTKEEIKKVEDMCKTDMSVRQMAHKLGKTWIQTRYYVRKFRKGKGKSSKPIVVNETNQELIGEFLGLFAGDGYYQISPNLQYRTYISFNRKDAQFADEVINEVLIKIFGKKPMIFYRTNLIHICYYSKNIHKLIDKYLEWDKILGKSYTIQLKDNNHSNDFMIGFLRGSIDSDGHIGKRKMQFASISEGLIRNICKFLAEIKIEHRCIKRVDKRENRKDIFLVEIRKPERNKFFKIINPRNMKCVERDFRT